jgi:hypothetical protein
VIHAYTSGWKGEAVIPDEPVPGALQFMLALLMRGWRVTIVSSRSATREGRIAMAEWLRKHAGACWYPSPGAPGLEDVEFPEHKPAALITIDDRAIQFTGTWPTIEDLDTFKPWNKK